MENAPRYKQTEQSFFRHLHLSKAPSKQNYAHSQNINTKFNSHLPSTKSSSFRNVQNLQATKSCRTSFNLKGENAASVNRKEETNYKKKQP